MKKLGEAKDQQKTEREESTEQFVQTVAVVQGDNHLLDATLEFLGRKNRDELENY